MTTGLTHDGITEGLRGLGLKQGDTVLLHSSLASLGHVAGGAETVVDAFLSVLGAEGTLAVPTFGALGIITDVVKRRADAVRSVHPKASVAALGHHAEMLCHDHWKAELAHGPETPYTRIAELDGYVCLLGVDQDRNTTLHTVEELARLPYLKTTNPVTFATPEGDVTKSWPFFPGPHRDFIGLDRLLAEKGALTTGRVGNAAVRLMSVRRLLEVAGQAAREDPAFALCDNPSCMDCLKQRAAIRRHRFAQEAFSLSVASSLAGRYAEEIAAACQLAGIGAVELDALNGRPVSMLGMQTVERAVALLREEGIELSGLRLPCVPKDLARVIELADRLQIDRLLLPLSVNAPVHAGACEDAELAVSFYNAFVDCDTASTIMQAVHDRGLPAGLTFSPAAFARAGEKPFLTSYRRKLRHHIDQLEIEDATFDGTPQVLARGNGEIKELMSVLRCRRFAGWFVLGAGNRAVGSLEDAVGRLETLLNEI